MVNYYKNDQVFLLTNYRLDPNIQTLSTSCTYLGLLVATILLNSKLINVNKAITKYKAGFVSKALDLENLKITLGSELKEVSQQLSKFKPYFEKYPDSFGWKWINSFKMSLNKFQSELINPSESLSYIKNINALQEIFQVAELGVRAHVEPQKLKILNDEMKDISKIIASYESTYPFDLQTFLTSDLVNIQLQAHAISIQLATESNYYQLLTRFAELSANNIPELEEKLIALEEATDKRLEEMNLMGLLDKCTSDVIALL